MKVFNLKVKSFAILIACMAVSFNAVANGKGN